MDLNLETTSDFKALALSNPNLVTLTDEELRQVQKIALETVHDIVSVCKDLGTNYHLTGGSALGAVRHHGFIPWDDDVDIDIARKDLKSFLREFSKRFSDKYWIHGPDSQDIFCIRCYQIRRKGTIFQGCTDPSPEECGIAVDLPVMENTFSNSILRRIHGSFSLALGLIVSCRRFYLNRKYLLGLAKDNSDIQRKFKRKIRIGCFFSFASLRWWTMLYDKWNSICHDEHSEYVTVPTGRYHFFGEMYPRSEFAETCKMQFEDIEVNIPKSWDKYLSHMYENYMELPPETEREKHLLVRFEIDDTLLAESNK